MTETTPFEMWAVVDVMGHQRYAGKVTEQVIAGCGFIRVDVPAATRTTWRGEETLPAFTKLLATGSIHSITPCTEDVARRAAAAVHATPIVGVDLGPLPQLPAAAPVVDEDHDREDEW